MGLRTRILLLVVLATLLLPVAAVSVHLIRERDRDIAEAKRNLSALARNAGVDLEEKIRGTTQLLFGLSQSRELDTEDKDACSTYLAEVLKQYPQYTGILTIKPNGELHCDSLRTGRKVNVTDRAYFNEASKSTRPAFDLVFGRLTGIAVMQVALGARDRRGELKFVLLASHNLDRFARQLAAAQPYPNTAVVIWDRSGTIMAAHPVPQGEKPAGKPYPDSGLFGFVRSGNSGDTAEVPSVFGALRVWGLGALPEVRGTGLRITLGVPKAELVAAADRNLRQALGFIFGAFLLVFVAAWALAELSIRRPAARIMDVVARFGAGDLAARVGQPYPRGEFGGLMQALDRTAGWVQEQQTRIAQHAERLRLLSHRLFEAEESERRRLARELHDRIGQNVAALTLNVNMIRGELPADCPGTVGARLGDCETLLSATERLVRNVMADLRPLGLEELGLLAALNEHAGQVAGRGGFSATVIGTEAVPRLPPAAEITLFRIAQEALMNVAKHARATDVSIRLESSPATVVLTIADNGCGFDPAARPVEHGPHLGMVSMRERAEAVGGRLRVESAPGQGTRVIVEAPRAAPANNG